MHKTEAAQLGQQLAAAAIGANFSEADTVFAMLVMATFTLANWANSIEELEAKLRQLGPMIEIAIPTNLEAFRLALEAHQKKAGHA